MRKRRFSKTLSRVEVFENALQSGGFRKRRFRVYVWTGENEGFRKRRFRVYVWTGENEGFRKR